MAILAFLELNGLSQDPQHCLPCNREEQKVLQCGSRGKILYFEGKM